PSRSAHSALSPYTTLFRSAAFMTALLPSRTETEEALMAAVTFVLARNRLVTVRYHSPRAFVTFPQRAEKAAVGCTDAPSVLISLDRKSTRLNSSHVKISYA